MIDSELYLPDVASKPKIVHKRKTFVIKQNDCYPLAVLPYTYTTLKQKREFVVVKSCMLTIKRYLHIFIEQHKKTL